MHYREEQCVALNCLYQMMYLVSDTCLPEGGQGPITLLHCGCAYMIAAAMTVWEKLRDYEIGFEYINRKLCFNQTVYEVSDPWCPKGVYIILLQC